MHQTIYKARRYQAPHHSQRPCQSKKNERRKMIFDIIPLANKSSYNFLNYLLFKN